MEIFLNIRNFVLRNNVCLLRGRGREKYSRKRWRRKILVPSKIMDLQWCPCNFSLLHRDWIGGTWKALLSSNFALTPLLLYCKIDKKWQLSTRQLHLGCLMNHKVWPNVRRRIYLTSKKLVEYIRNKNFLQHFILVV